MRFFETDPERVLLDNLLWPLLLYIWEPMTRGKISIWHWKNWAREPKYLLNIPKDKLDQSARERTGWWSSFWLTTFGWQRVVVLQPVKVMAMPGFPYPASTRYRIAFKHGDWKMICTIVLEGPVAPLLGPGEVGFSAYAYSTHGPPKEEPVAIPLAIVKYTNRRGLKKVQKELGLSEKIPIV